MPPESCLISRWPHHRIPAVAHGRAYLVLPGESQLVGLLALRFVRGDEYHDRLVAMLAHA